MLDFISKDVREYAKEIGREFTDLEKAAIIFNSRLTVEEIHRRLKVIADNTENELLRKQIEERLEYDRKCINIFKGLKNGFVYAVGVYGEHHACISGYFANADLAYIHGREKARQFDILKYPIVGYNGRDCEESEVAMLEYDDEGKLSKIYSNELPPLCSMCACNETEDCSSLRFEDEYVEMPNPFERGDIVKFVSEMNDEEMHGVVLTSGEEWKKQCEMLKVCRGTYDAAEIVVDCFCNNDGSFYNCSINPARLEFHEPSDEDEDKEVLLAGSAVYAGYGNLEEFESCCHDYKMFKRFKMIIKNRKI